MQAAMRAASVELLEDYAASAGLKLQVYRGRPKSLYPPTAFVDSIDESIDYTMALYQRHPIANVMVLHGLFDSGEAVDQRDAFVDGFLTWCIARIHAAGANTTLGLVEIEDVPDYVPEWMPPAEQKTYYGTRVVLEGLALGS